MADGTAGGGGGALPDLYWIFPNTVSTDQNNGLYTFKAQAGRSFVGFDIQMNVGPTSQAIIIDWAQNNVVNPAFRTTLPAGQSYAQLLVPVTLAPGDTLQPQVVQVGVVQPGQTATIRARGS